MVISDPNIKTKREALFYEVSLWLCRIQTLIASALTFLNII